MAQVRNTGHIHAIQLRKRPLVIYQGDESPSRMPRSLKKMQRRRFSWQIRQGEDSGRSIASMITSVGSQGDEFSLKDEALDIYM